jgi:hypothetical protein
MSDRPFAEAFKKTQQRNFHTPVGTETVIIAIDRREAYTSDHMSTDLRSSVIQAIQYTNLF